MAGDWIKMRTDLYRDPKVCVIADLLLDSDSDLARYVNQNYQRNMTVTRNVMRNAVVGALLSVWGVMRHRGKRNGDDLNCHGVSVSVIDDIADMRGFGEAMAHVCWVVEEDNCIVFPRFFADYNAEPGVQGKSKNAERQRRFREKKKAESNDGGNVTNNVTRDVTVTHREEKRREEKKEKDNGDFDLFWEFALTQYRRCDSKPGNKKEAEKEWNRLVPDSELQADMRTALEAQAEARINPSEFVANLKHVCRWIKNECWNDVQAEDDEDPTPLWMKNAL